jgi:hypothetical protein
MPRKSGNRFSGNGMRQPETLGMPRKSGNRFSGNGMREAL